MSTPTEPASIAPPPAQVIDDLPCRTCGYNLRTLAKDGVCPECATPVVASLRSELLREADPNWLRRMRSGCELAYAGIWAAWIWFIFFQGFHAGLFVTFAIPGAAAAAALGTWMLTIPDPSGIGEDRYGRLRVWARALGIAQFAAVLVSSLSRSAHLSVYPLCEGSEMFARFAWGATLLWYLDRLGRRTWRSKISTGYRIQAFLFVGMSAVSMAAWIALCIGTGPRSPVPWALEQRASLCSGIAAMAEESLAIAGCHQAQRLIHRIA